MQKFIFLCFMLLIYTTYICIPAPNNKKQPLKEDSMVNVKIQEIIARGEKYTDSRLSQLNVSIIENDQLTMRHENSILPTLNTIIPGIFITNRGVLGYGVSNGGSGGIKIRGIGNSPNSGVLVLIDGMPQYAGLYGHPIADNYQTFMVDRVEVVRGPASLHFGSNAMGGIINIATKSLQHDTVLSQIHLQGGSYYSLDAGITNQWKKGKFSSNIGFNYVRTDGHRANMHFDEYNAFIRMGYDFNKHWKLNATGDIAFFNSSNPGTITTPLENNDMHILRGTASLSLKNKYQRTSGFISVYYNGGNHKIEGDPSYFINNVEQQYHHKDFLTGISLCQSFFFYKGNKTSFGFDYQHLGGNAWYTPLLTNDSIITAKTTIINKKLYDLAGYIDFNQQITKWFIINIGIRFDWHSQAGINYVPQGSLVFPFKTYTKLLLSVSKGFRNPTIRELYMYRPANADLKAENLINYELSLSQHLFNNRLFIQSNVFYLNAKNGITQILVDGKPMNVNTGKMENVGCELELRGSITPNLVANANYSYLHMANPQIGAPEHKLNVSVNYYNQRFSVGTEIEYINGLFLTTGQAKEKENYTTWDAHLNVKIWKGLWINAMVNNLLGAKYEINKGYPMPRTTLMGGISWKF